MVLLGDVVMLFPFRAYAIFRIEGQMLDRTGGTTRAWAWRQCVDACCLLRPEPDSVAAV